MERVHQTLFWIISCIYFIHVYIQNDLSIEVGFIKKRAIKHISDSMSKKVAIKHMSDSMTKKERLSTLVSRCQKK